MTELHTVSETGTVQQTWAVLIMNRPLLESIGESLNFNWNYLYRVNDNITITTATAVTTTSNITAPSATSTDNYNLEEFIYFGVMKSVVWAVLVFYEFQNTKWQSIRIFCVPKRPEGHILRNHQLDSRPRNITAHFSRNKQRTAPCRQRRSSNVALYDVPECRRVRSSRFHTHDEEKPTQPQCGNRIFIVSEN